MLLPSAYLAPDVTCPPCSAALDVGKIRPPKCRARTRGRRQGRRRICLTPPLADQENASEARWKGEGGGRGACIALMHVMHTLELIRTGHAMVLTARAEVARQRGLGGSRIFLKRLFPASTLSFWFFFFTHAGHSGFAWKVWWVGETIGYRCFFFRHGYVRRRGRGARDLRCWSDVSVFA